MKKSELDEIIALAADEALQNCKAENPLEAWTSFIDTLDTAGRRIIGNQLTSAGKNRFTGESL